MDKPARGANQRAAWSHKRGETWPATAGLTLLELMLAFALFAIILASAMQAYISSHTGMIVQEQRTQAANLARGVLNNLREARDTPGAFFPDSLLVRYPDGSVVDDVDSPETSALAGRETITVEYGDVTANPLPVRVKVEWFDPRNRPMVLDLTTLMGSL